MYNRLPENEPWGLKHVEDIIKYEFKMVHFVGLCCRIIFSIVCEETMDT